MFCEKCGKEIDGHAKFCYACGAPVQQTIQPLNLDDDRTIGFADAFPNLNPASISAAEIDTQKTSEKASDQNDIGADPVPPKAPDLTSEEGISLFISSRIPKNTEDSTVMRQVKKAMVKIMPSYVETSNLASLLLECNPVKLAENLCSLDSDSLFHILSAIDIHMSKKEDPIPLNACKDGILFILSERIKRGELYA